MRYLMLALLCVLASLVAGEDNPFGVTQLDKDDKALNPALTQPEREFVLRWSRAKKDGIPLARSDSAAAMTEFTKRWTSGIKNWTTADAQARVDALADIRKCGSANASPVSMLFELNISEAIIQAAGEYISKRDDSPEHLVTRMELFAKLEGNGSWRKYVVEFMGQDKYKNTTPKQKYEFVGWLLPKVPSTARDGVRGLYDDLAADAGIAPAKPDTRKTK